ncbi:hypothetical protein J6590_049282 [Homalodisca vitripennis]|nr:hypothetical protein J6590_049282 [Homalodisca vitripennis]
MELIESERITVLMMRDRNPVSKSVVYKTVQRVEETGSVWGLGNGLTLVRVNHNEVGKYLSRGGTTKVSLKTEDPNPTI